MRFLLTTLLLLIGTLGVVACNPAEMTEEQLRVATPEEMTKQCQKGNAPACVLLGIMYDNGEGVKQDSFKAAELYRQAWELYRQACDGKDANGCFNLGVMYDEGKGVTQDDFKAVELYRQACDGQFGGGCWQLGWMYEQGNSVRQSVARFTSQIASQRQ